MIRSYRSVTMVTAALLSIVFAADDLHAYCPGPPVTWPSIPVRLHADLHTQLRHGDGTVWTRPELEHVVRRVISLK